MSLSYGEPKFENIAYSVRLRESFDIKVNLKKNQRKYNEDLRLFAAELAFLLLYIKPEDLKINRIVYIGAAPGFHLVKIMTMFNDLKFDLYDDQEIHPELQKYIDENPDQVLMFKEKFELDTCDRYEGSVDNIYLMTDHRDPAFMTDPYFTKEVDKNAAKMRYQLEKEESYFEDMIFQKEICKRLLPLVAFLRFRPPHFYSGISPEPAVFEYFKGNLFLMIYNDYKSTESRLIVTDFTNEKFYWNYKSYQYRLNYFNDEVRESLLANPFTRDQTPLKSQLGNKFETVMLIFLLKEYFRLQGYENIKSDSIISFYTDFIILESCSSITGMYNVCDTDARKAVADDLILEGREGGWDGEEEENIDFEDDVRNVDEEMNY